MLELNNMRPGEKVEMVIKRHWIIFVMLFWYFLFWAIVSWTSLLGFGFVVWNVLLNIVFWLFFLLFLYTQWLNHELDLFVVTDNRVIGVEQISFLNRNVSECTLWQVQEVNTNTKGFFANIFNYGTVRVQTAWANQNMVMAYVPDPIQSARIVNNIVDAYRDKHNPTVIPTPVIEE